MILQRNSKYATSVLQPIKEKHDFVVWEYELPQYLYHVNCISSCSLSFGLETIAHTCRSMHRNRQRWFSLLCMTIMAEGYDAPVHVLLGKYKRWFSIETEWIWAWLLQCSTQWLQPYVIYWYLYSICICSHTISTCNHLKHSGVVDSMWKAACDVITGYKSPTTFMSYNSFNPNIISMVCHVKKK